jgi:DNA polymerase III sliding clamp (beta) subunit (PCNA family)
MTTANLCAPRKRKFSAGVVTLDRKSFIQALDRARLVVAARSCKPILACVRLEIAAGVLTVQATDLDISLMLQLPAEGELAPTVVPCSELITRLKAGKDEKCNLHRAGDKFIINGGRVEHALQTLDPAEFPLVARSLKGDTLDVHLASTDHDHISRSPLTSRTSWPHN